MLLAKISKEDVKTISTMFELFFEIQLTYMEPDFNFYLWFETIRNIWVPFKIFSRFFERRKRWVFCVVIVI